jgi:hypothetical protein
LIGYIGVIAGLLICGAVAVLKYLGYKISVPVLWAEGHPLVEITWRHFIYAGIAIGAIIVVSVIFRLIGKAVYKRRVKKAIEEARKANSSSGNLQGYSIDPEMIEAAKKDNGRVGTYWKKNGCRESGSWAEVFGYFGAELCYAWGVATYIDDIAFAGKQIYDIFMYVNVWTDRNAAKGFSMAGLDYPAGGAVSKVLPAWYAAAPHLDAICPDIHDGEAEGIRLAQTN